LDYEIEVLIEISKNSHIKYEYDKERNALVCDRILHTPFKYFFNYGFIPNTLSEDGDPIDVVVITENELLPGCYITCKLLGYLETRDDEGNDPKLIMCPSKKVDPTYNDLNNIFDMEKFTKDKNGNYKVGKCVNMPYHGGSKGYCTRYCLTDKGEAIPLEKFFDYVEKFRITPKQFEDLKIQTDTTVNEGPEPMWNEYPPCTQAFIQNKVSEGQRNNALFNLAVLAHLKNPEKLKTELYERNKTCMNPPITKDTELDAIVDQIVEKEYFYQCETPIAKQYCNKEACRKRKFGIGPNQYIPTIDSFFKHNTSPPYYVLTLEGKQIQLLGKQIVQQQLLREELFDQADIVWQSLNKRDWNMFLVNLKAMQKEIEDMKPGDDEKEDFSYYTRMFIAETEPGDDMSQLQAGYIVKDEDFVYFNLHTFKDFLNKKKGKKSNQEVIRYLKNGGATSTTKANHRVWQIKLPEKIDIKPKKVDFKSKRTNEETPF
jgi:inorganic pyrophosphatase